MHGVNTIAGKILEQTISDHRLGAAQTFFRRLEDKVHLTLKITRGCQILCGGQQHDGMTIMSTGVHGALVSGTVIKGVLLQNRQRVHVGAQTNRAGSVALTQHANQTGLTDAAIHLYPKGLELCRDKVCCAILFKPQLGVRVQISAPSGEFRLHGFNISNQIHTTFLLSPRDCLQYPEFSSHANPNLETGRM